jgi:hypothetical protein
MTDDSDSSNEIIKTLNDSNNNEILDKIKNIFTSKRFDENNEEYKLFYSNFGSWSNDKSQLVEYNKNIILLTKNKNISLNVELKQRDTDEIFKKISTNKSFINEYKKCIVSSKFVNKIIIQNIINKLTKNSLKIDDFNICGSKNMDGYIISEKVSFNTTLANLNLNDIKIVHNDKQIENNDVKCFFILSQLLEAFENIKNDNFNHGKLTAHNIIVDVDDEKYIVETTLSTAEIPIIITSTKPPTPSSAESQPTPAESPSSPTTASAESRPTTAESPSSSTTPTPSSGESQPTPAESRPTPAESPTTPAESPTTPTPSSGESQPTPAESPSSPTIVPTPKETSTPIIITPLEQIHGGAMNEIKTNFRIKLNNFSDSSVTYKEIRYVSEFPKKMGVFEDNFNEKDYEAINKFYKQLDSANLNYGKIKNTIKDAKIFKKMLRHLPIPVPFTIEFYILIMSMMLCNDDFFIFFRKYYFNLLFDYNLTDYNLNDAENNKMIKSCISYKIYKLITEKKNNKNSIDIPLEILDDIYFKLKIVDKFSEKNNQYMINITDKIKNNSDIINIDINNVIKLMSEINEISKDSINENEIPDKIIIYINPSLRNKELINYYNKPLILNFNSLKKYDETKMNDTNVSFFKDKNTFKALVNRFESTPSSTNIYNAEISNDNKLGIVDNNILLTIKKSFPINSKIKFNNGKIYTIIDAKWEPGKWVKKTSNEIDKIDKIKNISKKKLKSYDISNDVVNKNITEQINLSYKKFEKNDVKPEVYVISKPEDEKKIFESINLFQNNKDNGDNGDNKKGIFESMNFFSNKNKIIIGKNENEEHDNLKKFFSNESFNESIANKKLLYIPGAIIEIKDEFINDIPIEIVLNYDTKFIDNFYKLFSSSVLDNNFYSFPFISDVRNTYNKFIINDENIKNIIEAKTNNDENYNFNLMKKYDEIKKNDNQLHSQFLKYELIFLKTCYNYYYLYTETKKEIDTINETLKSSILQVFNNINENKTGEPKQMNPVVYIKTLTELYNLKYSYEYYKLMYNYYLYGLYWWIIINIKIFSKDFPDKQIFTKEKIIPSYFSGKSTIDQKKYKLIVDNKHKVFLEILDSIFELKNFYKNNKTIEIFRKNKLMSMLFEDNNTLLYSELQKKITNDINNSSTNDKKYKIIEVNNDKNCFLNCLLRALKNNSSYDKDIKSFLDNSVDELRQKIIDSIKFKVEYYKIKKEKNRDNFIGLLLNNNNDDEIEKIKGMTDDEIFKYFKEENYFFNDFIILIISKIFNCMFYVYSSINGKEPIFKNITEYNNQPYSIIFYKDNNCYKLIQYNNNNVMNCEQLPEELQMSQYCYKESNSSNMTGGALIDDINKNISNKYSSIEASKNLINKYNKQIESEKKKYNTNISQEEKIRIKDDIRDKENEIKENNKKLVEYYKEIIKYYDELIKEYNVNVSTNRNELNNANNKIKTYKNELNQLQNKINLEKEKDKKVYGIIVDLILYPGDNPSIIDRQKYKCKKSFDDLKNEYCEVFGIGCSEKNIKNGGTMKNKIINKKKYTMKNI